MFKSVSIQIYVKANMLILFAIPQQMNNFNPQITI